GDARSRRGAFARRRSAKPARPRAPARIGLCERGHARGLRLAAKRAAARERARRAHLSWYRPSMYDSFDDFLKAAVKEYAGRGWKNRKGTFAALLIASGQTLSMAADSLKTGDGLK